MLELKMEVFTTRLKELEWEREQLRIERAALQVGVSSDVLFIN